MVSAWMPKPLPIQVRRPLIAATSETTVRTLALWSERKRKSRARGQRVHMRQDQGGGGLEEDVQNLPCNDETKDSALAERVKRVRGLVLLVTPVDGDVPASDGLVHLRHTQFRDGDRRGDGHDGGGHQVLRGHAKADICAEYGTSDGGEP